MGARDCMEALKSIIYIYSNIHCAVLVRVWRGLPVLGVRLCVCEREYVCVYCACIVRASARVCHREYVCCACACACVSVCVCVCCACARARVCVCV